MAERTPTKTVERVCISPRTKEEICLLCAKSISKKDFKRKLTTSAGQRKTKVCLNLEIIIGKELSAEDIPTNIVCRNCADKNDTIVRKLLEVREKYESSTKAIVAEKGKIVAISTKRLARTADSEDTREEFRPNKRALFLPSDGAIAFLTRDVSTQVDFGNLNEEESISAEVIIHFRNSPPRRVSLYGDKALVIRQLCFSSTERVVRTLVEISEWKDIVIDEVAKNITRELTTLSSLSQPSILRQKSKEQLAALKWSDIYKELSERCPIFLRYLLASASNPSQSRNVHKKGTAIHPPMLDAGCQLISVFNSDLDATRRIKSITLKKGGLKKIGFKRLSSLYMCLSYNSTITLMEKLGEGYDEKLVGWKEEVEKGVEKEMQIMQSVVEAQAAGDHSLATARELKLQKHRNDMHPGYSFTGDNVDKRCAPRQMTLKNRNKDHHLFQIVAFKNRVSSNHLTSDKPTSDINKIPFVTFLPSPDEQFLLKNDLVMLVGHKWAQYIPSLSWIKEYLPPCISHEYMDYTRQKTEKVNLGVLKKNEQYEEDMIDITQFMHKYVPGHDEASSESKPVKVLSGGDYLTFERHKEAQSAMQDARTPSSRLEGLIPKTEDFHTQMEWLQVIWHHFYNTTSARDTGTLHAMRNAIDARNVSADPHNRYYASSEFIDKVTDAYLINGAFVHFGMESVDGKPTKNLYEGLALDQEGKREYVVKVVEDFLDQYIIYSLPELSPTAPTCNDLKCRVCGKPYKRPTALKKHEEDKHGIREPEHSISKQDVKEDRVKNYTHQLLVLLLLRLDHNDAIKHGDGERVIRLYKYFCLYFKVSNCPKYSFAMLQLQAQVNALLTPRLAHSLTWNRFVNHQGKPDTNHPMDLEIEHDNKLFKNDCQSYRGEITEKTIQRIGRSMIPSDEILLNFDQTSHVKRLSGKHTMMSTQEDVFALVEHLVPAQVYSNIPGRAHSAFEEMPNNLLDAIDCDKLKTWISKSLKKFSRKHYY